MDKQLQELLDKKACEEVIMRYGRTLDWLDQAGQEQGQAGQKPGQAG